MMKVNIFLDLEETLINNFQDKWLLETNIARIKTFIEKIKPESVRIFSFAIHDEKDVADFKDSGLQKLLEWLLGVKFKNIHQVNFLNKALLKNRGTFLEDFEFISIFGKQQIFTDHVGDLDEKGAFVLIDGAVKTQITLSGKLDKVTATINVLDVDDPVFIEKLCCFIGE